MSADPHYTGNYNRDRDTLVARGNANPAAVCWRDGLTLAQHPDHKTGKRPTWTGGHHPDGIPHAHVWRDITRAPTPAELDAAHWLLLEASTCNYANGARRTNDRRANPQSRRWL